MGSGCRRFDGARPPCSPTSYPGLLPIYGPLQRRYFPAHHPALVLESGLPRLCTSICICWNECSSTRTSSLRPYSAANSSSGRLVGYRGKKRACRCRHRFAMLAASLPPSARSGAPATGLWARRYEKKEQGALAQGLQVDIRGGLRSNPARSHKTSSAPGPSRTGAAPE